MEALADKWKNLQSIIAQRDPELGQEAVRQEEVNSGLNAQEEMSSPCRQRISGYCFNHYF